MTDWSHVNAVLERLAAAQEGLPGLLDYPSEEFIERLRRWKQHTAQYIRTTISVDEAERFEKISTHWDGLSMRSFEGMINSHRGFLRVLSDEISARPHEVLMPSGEAPPRPRIAVPSRLFISHAASDKPLALALRNEIVRHVPDLKVFVASRPGHISTGEEWWTRITTELRGSDAFIVLLTPDSVFRPWVSFETGAAWFTRYPLLMLAHQIQKSDIPMPLSALQVSYVADPEELSAALRQIGIHLEDPAEVAHALELVQPMPEPGGWQGLQWEGRYFAWAGTHLHKLPDRDPEPAPAALITALEDVGLTASFALPRKLDRTINNGAFVLYETDRRTFRRKLWGVGGEQYLVVRPIDSV